MPDPNSKRRIQLISIDLQYDFTRAGGKHYNAKRTSINFVRETLIPFVKRHGIGVREIISDYRQPRPGDFDESCVPGTWGYKSEIPGSLDPLRFVKCLNSPLYNRVFNGHVNMTPGEPIPADNEFYGWLWRACPDTDIQIVLFGLTLDCCVLCTAQAIRFVGYDVKILMDATDTYNGGAEDKKLVMDHVVSNWAEPVRWNELRKQLLA